MGLPTSTLATYEQIGRREDLADVIYRIDPSETPFMSGIDKAKASQTLHEWQTQALGTAMTTNAQLEGDDANTDAVTVTVRRGNYCQIATKVPRVSGTAQVVDKAGRDDELAYQEMLKGLELKRDMEQSLIKSTGDTTGGAKDVGADGTPRRLGPVLSWIRTNTSRSTGTTTGTVPTGDGSDIGIDGTARAFTEAQLKAVLQSVWTNGGKPDTIMTGAFNKQVFSTFTGRASPIEDTKSKKITASVDGYESDFGTLKVIPNRFQRTRDVFAFQMDMWAIAYLNGRRMVSIPLAVTGDSVRRMVLSEYTLESRNEKASGAVYDLTVS